jgi:hypothetical protein
VNQTLPFGPEVRPVVAGRALGLASACRAKGTTAPVVTSVITPVVVICPRAGVVPWSVNQMLASGPTMMVPGRDPALSPVEYSVITPAGVILPMAWVVPRSLNHRLSSGPVMMFSGRAPVARPVVCSVADNAGVVTRAPAAPAPEPEESPPPRVASAAASNGTRVSLASKRIQPPAVV